MKKLILFLTTTLFILFSLTIEARDIPSGSVMILGDANLDESSTKFSFSGSTGETDTTEINLTGTYFVARNFGAGLMIGNEDSDTNDGATTSNESINLIGPVVNYNISFNDSTSLVITAGIIFASGDIDDGTGTFAKFDGDGTLFMVSVANFITDSIAINAGIRVMNINLDMTVATLPVSAKMKERGATIGFALLF